MPKKQINVKGHKRKLGNKIVNVKPHKRRIDAVKRGERFVMKQMDILVPIPEYIIKPGDEEYQEKFDKDYLDQYLRVYEILRSSPDIQNRFEELEQYGEINNINVGSEEWNIQWYLDHFLFSVERDIQEIGKMNKEEIIKDFLQNVTTT